MDKYRLNKIEDLFIISEDSKLKELAIPEEKQFINIESILKFIFILINIFVICYNVSSKLKEQNIYNITNKVDLENTTDSKNIKNIKKLENKSSINKTIVAIFAGRKRYLELLLKYLNVLKNNNRIEEIHFWQFTNDKKDEEYLDSVANLHKTTGAFNYFRSIYPLIENNEFNISIKQEKENGGAVLLINDKYEIIFQFINKLIMEISMKIGNNIYTDRGFNFVCENGTIISVVYNSLYYNQCFLENTNEEQLISFVEKNMEKANVALKESEDEVVRAYYSYSYQTGELKHIIESYSFDGVDWIDDYEEVALN